MSKIYSEREEWLNVITHAFGILIAVLGTILLIIKATETDRIDLWIYLTFGLSMIILYTASTLYHKTADATKRLKMRKADHIGIYFLIAGSYTPFCLITLRDVGGMKLFIAIWLMAAVGTLFKLFFTGRFEKISTITYVLMGWSAIFMIKPLMELLPNAGLQWILAGGLAYTIGAVLYSIKRIPYNHAIFHVFVLAGTFCHWMAVYLYL